MEAVNIHIGPLALDHAEHDAEGDVLYLHAGSRLTRKAKRHRRVTWSDSSGARNVLSDLR
jgi:hypothetical protein